MLLLIDENVPDSVARFLAARGHDVRYVRDLFPRGTPDPVIATLGDQLSALVVTWDRDFEALIRKIPDGNKKRFKNLGRISFKCREPRGRELIEEWIETIEFHHAQCLKREKRRLIMVVYDNGLKLL